MLARTRAIRFREAPRRRIPRRQRPRERRWPPFRSADPAQGLGGPRRQRQEPHAQPGRDRLGLAY